MSAEKLSNQDSKESISSQEASKEHLEKLNSKLEKDAEKAPKDYEKSASEARKEVEQEAISGKETRPDSSEKSSTGSITKAEKTRTYRMTMNRMQTQLSTPSKSFSKFIHNPAVEKSSEVVGSTIARPSGILGAGIVGFIGFTVLMYFARKNGFEISNRYTLIAVLFIGGWALGLLVELLVRSIKKVSK